MLAKYYTEIMKIQLREFKRLSKARDKATAQLKEYVGLLEDKEKAESSLNEFIERMTKQ